ncbi:hypothetical protein ACTFIZ_004704 [Dictyostelium cf. discoideum]
MATPNTNNSIELFDNLPLFFKGRLNEAIQKVSTSLDLFVLYVIDLEEDQTDVLKCISHQTVISFVKSKCILYKIRKDSTEFEFLSQHYPNHSQGSCFYFFDINGKVFKCEDIKKGFTFISILSLFKTANDSFEKQKQSLNSSKIEQKSKERRLILQKTFCTKPLQDSPQTTTTTTTTTTAKSPPLRKKSPEPEPEPYIPNDDYITKATMTTLIFKLTNGETLKAEFNVHDRLKDIKEFIKNNRTDENRPFDMITIYPKHLFTSNEYEKTLLELNLVPSATITLNPLDVSTKVEKKSSASANIHPPSSSSSSSTSSSSGSYFSSVKNYFSGFFGGAIEQSESKEQDKSSKSSYNNNSGKSSSQVKKRTNIHQINNNNNDDEQRKQHKDPKDDNNSYYNGNSTQFNGK